jgi:hypothetical protein
MGWYAPVPRLLSIVLTLLAAADRKLLLGILKTQNVTMDYPAMAAYMSTEGQTCTVDAIKNRMKKLKSMAKEEVTAT